ncbi:unnamed protein product [Cuscuta epithymum]|uniref:Uncharacterized protein n=1 Tax=Cuscuta epithymum TaxID=186058 RepID=A0AAV0EVS7_9ASTE|nr:unnamed protein product [Cuscuta epithymum]
MGEVCGVPIQPKDSTERPRSKLLPPYQSKHAWPWQIKIPTKLQARERIKTFFLYGSRIDQRRMNMDQLWSVDVLSEKISFLLSSAVCCLVCLSSSSCLFTLSIHPDLVVHSIAALTVILSHSVSVTEECSSETSFCDGTIFT